jgi:hypothetical protein
MMTFGALRTLFTSLEFEPCPLIRFLLCIPLLLSIVPSELSSRHAHITARVLSREVSRDIAIEPDLAIAG